jgi:hypothetical protein
MRAMIFAASMLALVIGAATLSGCAVVKCAIHNDRCN